MHEAGEGLGSAAALPVAVWAKILQQLPQQQRLSQCALVCTALADGAAQATVHLVLELQNPNGDAVQALQSWLAQHAGQLLTVQIKAQDRYPEPKPQLPLPLNKLTKLQHLQLEGFKLQLPGEEDRPCSSPGVNSIDRGVGSSSYAATTALSSLQHLELDKIELADISSFLQLMRVPQLCSVAISDPLPLCNLELLPSSITRLVLQRYSLPPKLPQLSELRQLEMEGGSVPPSVLSCFTQLQVLHMLDFCKLLPHVEGDNLATEGTAALLDALLHLTHLQDLRLQLWCLDIVNIAPERFAALTASSHLTQLFLTRDHDANLPVGAVQHLFPVGRQMQSLQRLTINTEASYEDVWCVTAADLGRISQCCPKLQWLDICGSVEPGADLAGLLQLPECCTSLLVGGARFDDTAVPSVLQLTQLKHLSWSWAEGFTDVGLEQLVGLDLDMLHVLNCGLSVELHSDKFGDEPVELQSHPVKGSVSKQLDALCDCSPVLAPTRFPKYREAMAAQLQLRRYENSWLCQELARSRLEVQQLRQQLAEQQQ